METVCDLAGTRHRLALSDHGFQLILSDFVFTDGNEVTLIEAVLGRAIRTTGYTGRAALVARRWLRQTRRRVLVAFSKILLIIIIL